MSKFKFKIRDAVDIKPGYFATPKSSIPQGENIRNRGDFGGSANKSFAILGIRHLSGEVS